MKKIAIAVCLFGTVELLNAMEIGKNILSDATSSSSNAIDARKMEEKYNAFQSASGDFTSNDKSFSLLSDPKENTEKLEIATKELERSLVDVSEILSDYDSNLSSNALELSEDAEYCHSILGSLNCDKKRLRLYRGSLSDSLNRNKVNLSDDSIKENIFKRLAEDHSMAYTPLIKLFNNVKKFDAEIASRFPQYYHVKNGMTGMNRDIILRLIGIMEKSPEKIRAVMGISQEHLFWKGCRFFKKLRSVHPVPYNVLHYFQKITEFAETENDPNLSRAVRAGVQVGLKAILLLKKDKNTGNMIENYIKDAALPIIQKTTSDSLVQYKALIATIQAALPIHNLVICDHMAMSQLVLGYILGCEVEDNLSIPAALSAFCKKVSNVMF